MPRTRAKCSQCGKIFEKGDKLLPCVPKEAMGDGLGLLCLDCGAGSPAVMITKFRFAYPNAKARFVEDWLSDWNVI